MSSTHSCLTVHKSSARASNQQQRESDYERATIAYEAVQPPPFAKGIGAGAEEEDEKDVEGHGKGPPRVGLHEPNKVSKKYRCQRD